MTTTSTVTPSNIEAILSDFCGTRIETVGDLMRVANDSGIQPSDILSAAINLYNQGKTINGA